LHWSEVKQCLVKWRDRVLSGKELMSLNDKCVPAGCRHIALHREFRSFAAVLDGLIERQLSASLDSATRSR